MKNGAQIFLECLIHENVKHIFGMPGGVLIPLYDTFKEYPQIQHILIRQEQAAAFAADAYCRTSTDRAVCLATSGPGATNLVTGIASAYMDSVPLVAITGQVLSNLIGSDAFQEVDILGITLPITKHNYLVSDAKDLPRVIKEAFHIAFTGRPGPVHIDITKDVWTQKIANWSIPSTIHLPGYNPTLEGSKMQIKKAAEAIEKAKKPVIIAGHGEIISKAHKELLYMTETLGAPVVTTLLGIGSIPCNHPYCFHMIGMHGEVSTNYAIQNADLIMGIGLRFDDRVTGHTGKFAAQAKIIHIDIDPAEIGKNVKVDIPIVGDCKHVLTELNNHITKKNHESWIKEIRAWRDAHDIIPKLKNTKRDPNDCIYAFDAISGISKACGGECIVCSDVGQNQMWTAQYFFFQHAGTYINSGGLGSMGFGLPAAMGAKKANPHKEVWAICGDGGFLMNAQELVTLVENKINVKIAILNNNFLGMVRQWQDLFFNKNFAHTGLHNPDFVKFAESCGIKALRAETVQEARDAIQEAHEYNEGPILVEFRVFEQENVFPIVPPGAALHELITDQETPKRKKK